MFEKDSTISGTYKREQNDWPMNQRFKSTNLRFELNHSEHLSRECVFAPNVVLLLSQIHRTTSVAPTTNVVTKVNWPLSWNWTMARWFRVPKSLQNSPQAPLPKRFHALDRGAVPSFPVRRAAVGIVHNSVAVWCQDQITALIHGEQHNEIWKENSQRKICLNKGGKNGTWWNGNGIDTDHSFRRSDCFVWSIWLCEKTDSTWDKKGEMSLRSSCHWGSARLTYITLGAFELNRLDAWLRC